MSRRVPFNPKLTACQFQQFPSRRKFLHFQIFYSIFKFFRSLKKKVTAIPLVVQFCKNSLRICLKDKNYKPQTFKRDRSIGSRITVVKLVVWAERAPGLIGLKAKKYLQKICSGIHYFLPETASPSNVKMTF